MLVTVAICTWNRAGLLDQTLAEMHKLRVPQGVEWELIVVNNNCTDKTDEVLARHEKQLPLRRIFEPRPGKSHAANSAIAATRGELLLWTDDDALVSPDWIGAYVAAAARWPEASFFGGPVRPWFESSPPDWLANAAVWKRVDEAYATRDLGSEPFVFTKSKVPFGINMAFRTEAQKRYLFDPELGPRPNSTLRGEETALVRGMIAAGEQGWWVPEATVQHFVPRHRQTTHFLRGFYFGQGQVIARQQEQTLRAAPQLLGAPRWMWKRALSTELRYRRNRLAAAPTVWIDDLINTGLLWGQLHELRHLQRKKV